MPTREGVFVISAIVDVSQRKAADLALLKLHDTLEQRVLERTAELDAANKELDAFSYSVSHDLRAPLRAINGFAGILLDDFAAPLPEPAKVYLQRIRGATRQMGQLVQDLLALSHLGRHAIEKQPVEPAAIVRTCLAEMTQEQECRQIEIVIGDLPTCQADPALLKHVWMNLLSNALKYTRKQAVARIEIGSRVGPRTTAEGMPIPDGTTSAEVIYFVKAKDVVYFVKDNGAGFDMEEADRLFGVFERLHPSSDYEGTGVGLAIVQRIVQRHGGRIWAEAEVNRGATFFFTLE